MSTVLWAAMTFRWCRRNPLPRDRRPTRRSAVRRDYELALQAGDARRLGGVSRRSTRRASMPTSPRGS